MTIHTHRHLHGLTEQEVAESRRKYGANLLTPRKRTSVWKLYLQKFNDPVIQILLVAACLSLGIAIVENEYAETIGIIAAILLATGIGFLFELDANKKFDLLNQVNEETLTKVIRNGQIREVPRKDIVVGDVVVLETGEEIPADGELVEAISLQVNESNLTGELVVSKTTHPEHFKDDATYPSNRLLRGTMVVDGHATYIVNKVGDATEIGKVAQQSTEERTEPTPLNIQLERLADLIGKVGFTVATLAFLVFFIKDVLLHYDFSELHTFADWMPVLQSTLRYFMMAVTLIVVAVPEGLPMSVTLSLALNMRRMLKTNNLVRKMHASETMGAVTVICTDKTGTLTQNQMQVQEMLICRQGQLRPWLHDADEKSTDILSFYEGIAANSTAFLEKTTDGKVLHGVGNPTETALLLWLEREQVNYLPMREKAELINQLTFSTERKYMATLVKSAVSGRQTLYVKGAPEVILAMCKPLGNASETSDIHRLLLAYQQKAMRTLAFACKTVEETGETDCLKLIEEGDLTFMGVTAISDPVRTDVPEAISQCREAGIDVKIVTGDTSATAIEVGRQIGLWNETDTEHSVITGKDFSKLSDKEALERVMGLKVMSRARPMDKQRLVQLLQKKGAVVAVTGDGTNDAPALNHAQVGLSMGSGTSVAKEASDITLLDNSFRSISVAVMWGRSLYKNIQRFILFQLTINFIALLIVLIGAFIGTELPLTVTQMLWVNLIMDTFAALALASIPPNEAVMKEHPRRTSDFIITRGMWANIIGTGTIFLSVLLALLYAYHQAEGGMTIHRLSIFFTVFVMLQFWNLFNARAFGGTDSAFKNLSKSYGFELVAVIILAGQFLIVQFGGEIFRTEPLDVQTWVTIIASTSLTLWAGETIRLIQRLHTH